MAILLIGLLGLGMYMADLPLSPDKLRLYSWHKWAGVTAFLLLLIRLLWRVTKSPAGPAGQHAETDATDRSRGAFCAVRADVRHSPVRLADEFRPRAFRRCISACCRSPICWRKQELGHLLGEVHESLSWLFILVLVGRHRRRLETPLH